MAFVASASSAMLGDAAELDREAVDGLRELGVQLLDVARDADRPAAVAEVALDLAHDVRGGEGGELDAAVDVEAVDGLDEADRADLHEVVERLAAVGVAAGDVPDQGHHPLDELTTRLEVAVPVIALEQGQLVGDARHGGLGGVLGAHLGWASVGGCGPDCWRHPRPVSIASKAVKGGQAAAQVGPTTRSRWTEVVSGPRDMDLRQPVASGDGFACAW